MFVFLHPTTIITSIYSVSVWESQHMRSVEQTETDGKEEATKGMKLYLSPLFVVVSPTAAALWNAYNDWRTTHPPSVPSPTAHLLYTLVNRRRVATVIIPKLLLRRVLLYCCCWCCHCHSSAADDNHFHNSPLTATARNLRIEAAGNSTEQGTMFHSERTWAMEETQPR